MTELYRFKVRGKKQFFCFLKILKIIEFPLAYKIYFAAYIVCNPPSKIHKNNCLAKLNSGILGFCSQMNFSHPHLKLSSTLVSNIMFFLLSSKNLKYIDKVHVTRPIPGDNDVGGLILMTEFRYWWHLFEFWNQILMQKRSGCQWSRWPKPSPTCESCHQNIVGFDSRHKYLSYRRNFMIFGHTYRTDMIFFCGAK